MASITLHRNAQKDLDRMKVERPKTFHRVLVDLSEIAKDEALHEKLQIHGTHSNAVIGQVDIKKWLEQFKAGNHVWILKTYESGRATPYRLIFAFHQWTPLDPKIYYKILAVLPREIGYELDTEFAKRVENDFRELVSF